MEPPSTASKPPSPEAPPRSQEPPTGTDSAVDRNGVRYGLVELESGTAPRSTTEEEASNRDESAGPHLYVGTQEKPPAEPLASEPVRQPLALFCCEAPDSPVGQYVSKLVEALSRRRVKVHLFTRLPFAIDRTGVTVHVVSETPASAPPGAEPADEPDGLLERVEDFTLDCAEAFNKEFPADGPQPALMGVEWSAIDTLQMLREHTQRDFLLSLSSLERQRSNMSSELSKRIEETEIAGLRDSRTILAQEDGVSEAIRLQLPECAGRVVHAVKPFPTQRFQGVTDPGKIKARYQIGPIDPTILYVGDLDERHGPDVLMRSVQAILRNQPQARFVFVGDGDLLWPLRVYARYLLLEGVVRVVGHVEGQALYELIQAADVIVVPSRQPTEWWTIQAAWAARKPVVATHDMRCNFLEHERNAVLVYPHESSVVWGVERILYDPTLREALGHNGYERLEERFGWVGVAAQVEELLLSKQPT